MVELSTWAALAVAGAAGVGEAGWSSKSESTVVIVAIDDVNLWVGVTDFER